jgi:hypothetical protein
MIVKYLFYAFILSLLLSCSSTPLPENLHAYVPEDFFGMVHAGGTGSLEEYELLDELGVRWILTTFYWNKIESEQGKFDFSLYESYVNTAKMNNKKVIAVLAYEVSWLYPSGKSKKYIPPENIPYFLNFVDETVRHFEERVDAWEIWNEPNWIFWKGPKKDYYELTKKTAQKIKEIDPGIYILGGAFWRAPKRFIKEMHKTGAFDYLDGLAFHPYAVNPSASMKIYDNFANILSEINYTGHIWITEIGYPTAGWYPTRVSQSDFPSYVAKTLAGAAARGAKVLLWYELFDSYNEGEVLSGKLDSEKYFGLAYPNYKRKNAAWAYELCAQNLPGSSYIQELPIKINVPSNIVSYCFMNGNSGKSVLILWNDRHLTQKVQLSLSSPMIVHDITTGTGRIIPNDYVFDLNKVPVFVTWEGSNIPRLSMNGK